MSLGSGYFRNNCINKRGYLHEQLSCDTDSCQHLPAKSVKSLFTQRMRTCKSCLESVSGQSSVGVDQNFHLLVPSCMWRCETIRKFPLQTSSHKMKGIFRQQTYISFVGPFTLKQKPRFF